MTLYLESFLQSLRNRRFGKTYQKTSEVSITGNPFKISVFTAILFVLAACTSPNTSENPKVESPQKSQKQSSLLEATKTLKTVMTAEGVECPAVRGADGTLYTIASMPHKFDEGDILNIIIANPIVPVASFCQQGETIDWIRIEKVSANGEILKHWER